MQFIQGMNIVGNLLMSWQISALFIALTVVVVLGFDEICSLSRSSVRNKQKF